MIHCVFVGPTLAAAEVQAELDTVCLPPVALGDVYRAARQGPRAIGIIDGYFDRVPAVWHKEILWAMTQGIHVYGSASMGALRAAELETFGMVGVGRIFEAFRDEVLEDDDEVAVAHASAEHGYCCLSEAMVNIRATLERAGAEGVLQQTTGAALAALAKAIFYPERSYPLLLQRGAAAGLPPPELERLRDWLPANHVNQKRLDALAMLQLMRQQLTADPAPKRVEFHFENTAGWSEAMRQAGAGSMPLHEAGTLLTTDALLDELRLQGAPYHQALAESQRRELALAEARRQGQLPGAQAVQAQVRDFCRAQGLEQPEALERWLNANHLTRAQFDALLGEEVLVEGILADRSSLAGLFDFVRLRGQYQSLHLRLLDKQRRLEAAGLQHASLEDANLTEEALLQWHCARLNCPVPSDPRRHAQTYGFENYATFLRALLREYCYVQLLGPVGKGPTP